MFFQADTAATFKRCLFVGPSVFSFKSRLLTSPLKNIQILCHQKVLVYSSFFLFRVLTYLFNFEVFVWTWSYTPENMFNMFVIFSLAGIHVHPITLPPHGALYFESWSAHFLLCTFIFPSFWHKFILDKEIFSPWKGYCNHLF